MSNIGLLITGYVLVTAIYVAYWVRLRLRLRRLERAAAKGV